MRTSGVPTAWCVAALGLLAQTALAQPVFFDDFDGNALLPHWGQPPASHWQHNVSNGMLNVTGLFFPSDPKSTGNYAAMSASYAPQRDFRIDVWMGWQAGDQPHRLDFLVLVRAGIVASFGYRNEDWLGPTPVILAGTSSQIRVMPAPAPAIHHFRIARVGAQYTFHLNGELFASLAGGTWEVDGMYFDFVAPNPMGPTPGRFGSFHIDRVVVVPTPASWLVLAPLSVLLGRGRQRPSSASA